MVAFLNLCLDLSRAAIATAKLGVGNLQSEQYKWCKKYKSRSRSL